MLNLFHFLSLVPAPLEVERRYGGQKYIRKHNKEERESGARGGRLANRQCGEGTEGKDRGEAKGKKEGGRDKEKNGKNESMMTEN